MLFPQFQQQQHLFANGCCKLVLLLSPKLWPVKDEFLKFAADILAKLSVLEYLNVIHVTVEKQSCLGYVAKL